MSSSSSLDNIPFSARDGFLHLPSARVDFEARYSAQQLKLHSFFDHPFFQKSSVYVPPTDFLTRPRRESGDLPESVYPQKLAAWFYSPDLGYPFVFEEARDLYFSLRVPFVYLSQIFAGPQVVSSSNRKNLILSLVSKFDHHLVRHLFSLS